jgi:hypothetical protein
LEYLLEPHGVQHDKSLPTSKYQTAHFDPKSNALILRLVDKANTYTKAVKTQYLEDILSTERVLLLFYVQYK